MSDLQQLDDAALVRDLVTKQHALVRARFQKGAGKLDNTASIGVLRRGIARARTEIRRRERAQGLAKDSLLAAHPIDQRSLGGTTESTSGGSFLSGVTGKITG
jgi:ribosomal protein L29